MIVVVIAADSMLVVVIDVATDSKVKAKNSSTLHSFVDNLHCYCCCCYFEVLIMNMII